MLYKEWTTVRLKFGLYSLIYLGLALLFVTIWSDYRFGFFWHDPQAYMLAHPTEFKSGELPTGFGTSAWFKESAPQAMYYGWLNIIAVAAAVAGVLGGVDLVSEEVDKSTLSFLLTKPIQRSRIYLGKIAANVLALAAACSLVSLPILLLDQLNLRSINLGEGLSATFLAILLGATIICLSGIISIFSHTTFQSLIFSIVIIFSLLLLLLTITNMSNNLMRGYSLFSTNSVIGNSILMLLLSGVVALLCWLGVTAFQHKEF